LKPDLVFGTDGTPLETVHALQDKGIPVFRLQSTPTALEQIAAKIQAIGYITGNDEGARRELDRFNGEWKAITAQCRKPHPPARIYAVSMTGFSFGDQTLFQEIIGILGGLNVAAAGGMHTYQRVDNPTIATWKPDWVFTWAVPERAADELSRWLEDPSLSRTPASQNKHVIVSEPSVLLPLSPLVTRFARLMADTTCPAE
jgi:ABC-type Fe3+-hydroxamate transport system substrate-binding protein